MLALSACSAAPRPFPLRDPLRVDTDLHSVSVECHEEGTDDDPHHRSCAPENYVSPLAWDGVDNSIFRPLVEVFAVDPGGEAVNVNSFDEVADSAWFTNRLGARELSIDEIKAGACERNELLDGEKEGDGAWLIVASKGGSKTHPAWLNNMIKHPDDIWLEVGKRKMKVHADALTGAAREEAYGRIAAEAPNYGDYPKKTDRVIPVIRLTPVSGS